MTTPGSATPGSAGPGSAGHAASPRRPGRWAARTVRLAALALPAGPVRDRYDREFVSELYGLGRARQFSYALGVLSRAGALRAAVGNDKPISKEAAMATEVPRPPLACRWHLHHVWRTQSAEDGTRYRSASAAEKTTAVEGTGPETGPPEVPAAD